MRKQSVWLSCMCEINDIKKALLYYKDIFSETYGRHLLLLWMCFIDIMLRFTITIRGGAIKIAELIVDQSLLSYHADLTSF